MKVFGAILLMSLLGWVICSSTGEYVRLFINMPTLVLILGGMLAVLMMSHSTRAFSLLFKYTICHSDSFNDDGRLELSSFFNTARRAGLAMGGAVRSLALLLFFYIWIIPRFSALQLPYH